MRDKKKNVNANPKRKVHNKLAIWTQKLELLYENNIDNITVEKS